MACVCPLSPAPRHVRAASASTRSIFHFPAQPLQLFFVLDLKTGGDLEYYLLHMDRQFNEDEVRFFAAEILLGLKVSRTRTRSASSRRRSSWA